MAITTEFQAIDIHSGAVLATDGDEGDLLDWLVRKGADGSEVRIERHVFCGSCGADLVGPHARGCAAVRPSADPRL